MDHPHIRSAQVADARSIARVHIASSEEAYRRLAGAWKVLDEAELARKWEGWLTAAQDDPMRVEMVAEVDGDVVGFATAGPARRDDLEANLELYVIHVLPSHRGRGVGGRLWSAICGEVRGAELKSFYVATFAELRCCSFYEARGGELVERELGHYQGGEVTKLVYRWPQGRSNDERSHPDRYWAEFFGVSPKDWAIPGTFFRPHVGLLGYRGLWCFRRKDRVVVSAPPAWVPRLERSWAGWDAERLVDRDRVAASLGSHCERCIGPAFQGWLDPSSFQALACSEVRPLRSSDRASLERFKEECGEDDWEASGLAHVGSPAYVHDANDELTAMAGLRQKSSGVGDLCVLAHPRHRGSGRGGAVVSAVARDAAERGTLVLYQTLESNEAAVRLALSLGFGRYATHLAARLNSDLPPEVAR